MKTNIKNTIWTKTIGILISIVCLTFTFNSLTIAKSNPSGLDNDPKATAAMDRLTTKVEGHVGKLKKDISQIKRSKLTKEQLQSAIKAARERAIGRIGEDLRKEAYKDPKTYEKLNKELTKSLQKHDFSTDGTGLTNEDKAAIAKEFKKVADRTTEAKKIHEQVKKEVQEGLKKSEEKLKKERDEAIKNAEKKIDAQKLTAKEKAAAKKKAREKAEADYQSGLKIARQAVPKTIAKTAAKRLQEQDQAAQAASLAKERETFKVTDILLVGDQKKPKFFEKAESQGISPILAAILEVINFAIFIIGSFAFLMMVAGGFLMMTTINSDRNEQGKNMFIYSIVGVVIAFSSFIIITFIQSLFA